MSEYENIPEIRTLTLDSEVVAMLVGLAEPDALPSFEELRSALPLGLSVEEVNHVGLQVQNRVELAHPSWDGVSRGAGPRPR